MSTKGKKDDGKKPVVLIVDDEPHIVDFLQPGFEYKASAQNIRLCADEDRLQQVLLNLVENALKFTPATGLISLAAQNDDEGWVRIEVEDTGAGIPAEALPHVFDRFYRADQSRTRSAQQISGNGLGLVIAKELVEAHGGMIEIESSEGWGTKAIVQLPKGC